MQCTTLLYTIVDHTIPHHILLYSTLLYHTTYYSILEKVNMVALRIFSLT